ncbi:MAG: GWxTD domain-containing protein [Thermoanaerobaculia bacterium]
MRNLHIVVLLTCVASVVQAGAPDPAAALAAAKADIAAKKYSRAVAVLEPAIDACETIADPAQQKQALTAVHFYMAVAHSGMRRDDDALSHLRAALRHTPNLRAVDPTRYDDDFVDLFNRARAEVADNGRFETLYPGFSSIGAVPPGDRFDFGDHPALEILGSAQEKREWRAAAAPDARERFLAGFWKGRDRTPGTEANEFRDTFLRRVAFADSAFETPLDRGSMTDRGRVFTLLGEPAYVRRRALTNRDAIQAFNRNSIGIEVGTIEYWFYTREQLSVAHAQPTIAFRFVSHQGIGTFILQKDGVAVKTLAGARE